jgi:hypothetical protein
MPVLDAVLAAIARPLISLLSPVWTIDQTGEFIIHAALTLWAYFTLLRIPTLIICRACGWDAPHNAGWWAIFTPLPWRWPYRVIVAPFNYVRRQRRKYHRPNAQFESLAGTCARYVCYPGRLPIGVLVWRGVRLWQVIGLKGERGINLIGAPGSGKSATFGTILGSLNKGASALFVDAGGDLSIALKEYLTKHHKFAVVELGKEASAKWSLFAELAAAEQRGGLRAVLEMIKAAAEALVPISNDLQPTFDIGARDYVAAVIAFVYLFAEPGKKTLGHVRHLICCGIPHTNPKIDPTDNFHFDMEDCHKEEGPHALVTALIARGAATMRGSNNHEGGNPFMASARRATSWLDTDTTTCGSDFLMADLQQGNQVVSIVGSVGQIRGAYQPLCRLMLSILGHVYTTMPRRKGPAGLVIADEAQNLNRLDLVESGPHMRKYRLRLLAGWQDLPGVAAAYPKTWESILSAADANLFFQTSDKRTLEWISAFLGKTTTRIKVDGTPWWLYPFVAPARRVRAAYREEIIDLKSPAQVKDTLSTERGRLLVLSGHMPFIAAVHPYWRALPVSRYVSPGYRETLGRQLGRRMLRTEQHA